MTRSEADDIRIMAKIKAVLNKNEDVEVKKDKDGKIKVIASKKTRIV